MFGDFLIAPAGHFLLCKAGTVLRLSPDEDEDLKLFTTLRLSLAATVALNLGVAVIATRDGSLKLHSYAEFRPQATIRTGTVAYQVALDSKQNLLYTVTFGPKALTDRPHGHSSGAIHVYGLQDLLSEK
jgi:hypothetical protein